MDNYDQFVVYWIIPGSSSWYKLIIAGTTFVEDVLCIYAILILRSTPHPLYNTIVGVHSINRVS